VATDVGYVSPFFSSCKLKRQPPSGDTNFEAYRKRQAQEKCIVLEHPFRTVASCPMSYNPTLPQRRDGCSSQRSSLKGQDTGMVVVYMGKKVAGG
jgi:hypothetical protein